MIFDLNLPELAAQMARKRVRPGRTSRERDREVDAGIDADANRRSGWGRSSNFFRSRVARRGRGQRQREDSAVFAEEERSLRRCWTFLRKR